MNEPELGKLIETPQQRDAVHVAIFPVIAAHKLAPGQDIGFVDGSLERVEALPGAAYASRRIGIVDPFLKTLVFPEQRFWVFLYPRTITSLRHDWTHPEFETPPVVVHDKAASESWMRTFAHRAGLDYETALDAGRNYLATGERYVQQGSEAARDEAYKSTEEFWKHFKVLTGCDPDSDDMVSSPFCCSC